HLVLLFLPYPPTPPHLHSFPTRRSSDLAFLEICGYLTPLPAREIVSEDLEDLVNRAARHAMTIGYRDDAVEPTILFGGCLIVRRSEEHTSELQSLTNLVCRLLLEQKKHT